VVSFTVAPALVVMVTVAPGMSAPVGSVMVPRKAAVDAAVVDAAPADAAGVCTGGAVA